MFQKQLQKMKDVYNKYPCIFWILMVITFIDRIGVLSTIGFLGLQRVRNRDAVAVAALQENA